MCPVQLVGHAGGKSIGGFNSLCYPIWADSAAGIFLNFSSHTKICDGALSFFIIPSHFGQLSGAIDSGVEQSRALLSFAGYF